MDVIRLFKTLLRLTTLIFPLYIVLLLITWFITWKGGDISHFPYAFHPLFEVTKSEGATNDTTMINFILFCNMVICFNLTKIFTTNIQYENPIVEFVGAPIAIFFLVSWFNPKLYEIASIPGEILCFYLSICIVINVFLLFTGKKLMGIPGLKFGSGLLNAYNNQTERLQRESTSYRDNEYSENTNKTFDRTLKIHKVTKFANTIQIQVGNYVNGKFDGTSTGYNKFGELINWTESSVTIKENDGWVRTYGLHGEIINSWRG